MSMQQTSLDQAFVEKWLQEPENQSFTNNFLLNCVKQHPELHKEILLKAQSGEKMSLKPQLPHQLFQQHKVPTKKGCSAFLPTVSDTVLSVESRTEEAKIETSEGNGEPKSLSASLLPQASSKASILSSDSGVELLKSCDTVVKSEVIQEKRESKAIAIKPEIGEQEQVILQKKIKQLEGVLELVVAVLVNLTNPQHALTKILSYTKHLVACIKCRFLLLEDKLNNPSGKTPKFIQAFETASDKSDVEFMDGKEVDIRKLTGINVAIDVVKKGHLFMHDTSNDMLCYPLFGVEGQIIGVIQLFGDSLKSLDLDFVEQLALISGLVVDNSVSFSTLRKATKKLLCVSTKLETVQKKAIQTSLAENSKSKHNQMSRVPCTPRFASTPNKPEVTTTKKRACESIPVKTEAKPEAEEKTETKGTPINEDGEQETIGDEKPESASLKKEAKTETDSLNESEITPAEESVHSADDAEPAMRDFLVEVQSKGDESQKKKQYKGLRVFKAPFEALKKLMHRA